MKQSQLIIKAQDQAVSAIELTSRDTNCELALVSLNVMRELLNAHAVKISLRELKERMIDRIDTCDNIADYKAMLAYDLNMLTIHENLKAYDDAKHKEKQAEIKVELMSTNP